jgi:hypothetical protein
MHAYQQFERSLIYAVFTFQRSKMIRRSNSTDPAAAKANVTGLNVAVFILP